MGSLCCYFTRASRLSPGQKPSDQRIGVTMAQLVLGLEVADKFHVLERPRLLENMHPIVYGFAVLFFNRWKVGSRAFYRFLGCHASLPFRLLRRTNIQLPHGPHLHAAIFHRGNFCSPGDGFVQVFCIDQTKTSKLFLGLSRCSGSAASMRPVAASCVANAWQDLSGHAFQLSCER